MSGLKYPVIGVEFFPHLAGAVKSDLKSKLLQTRSETGKLSSATKEICGLIFTPMGVDE